ncbi:DUF58 domain-containing protein [Cellulomonas edaphi]|uniref:DUF58 domain-containing protein n=1 Tax=Cellulomonas edaphi TaxID=3053468 RepID=A0ABT7S8U4_9CELL|nr:DUF58 domain-containing protein [Cellulomons edaphi]MDM7832031.1 DUF58 domain-containing protein [Cellulomons edaphi]
MRLRPTARGWGLAGVGLATLGLGTGMGSTDLVRIAALALLCVGGAAAVVAWRDPARGRSRIDVERLVMPNPVHAGSVVGVDVHIRAHDVGSRTRLAGLRFAEQAATELSAGRPLKAQVSRERAHVTVSYTVEAARRGRWPIGPLVVTRSDVFGTVTTSTTLGDSAEVRVWPTIAALPTPSDVLVGEPDRVALGARSPSTDDASLRDYREGDDLRRVHWSSSARRGALMVRSDERAGMRPVSVLMDLPLRSAGALEWTISAGASMALAMLDAGHPVRMLDGTHVSAVGTPFVHARTDSARSALLDRTIDLERPRAAADAEKALIAAAHMLDSTEAGGEIVLAVLGALSVRSREALAHVVDTAQGWAMVRSDGSTAARQSDAEHTVRALRRAGWRAVMVEPGEDVVGAWTRMLGSVR